MSCLVSLGFVSCPGGSPRGEGNGGELWCVVQGLRQGCAPGGAPGGRYVVPRGD
jgi:hypothetical protein